jgi:uncharacterized membrane protein
MGEETSGGTRSGVGMDGAASVEESRPVWRRIVGRILNPLGDLSQIEKTRWYSICLIAVGVLALAFTVFFCVYLFGRQDAFQTNGEDLGIMDQALWNTLHGAILHQTICNPISDTNCLGDISRFAIHFEPFMLPLSLVYVIAPSPKTLFLIQTVVVATGAFPAFWIASRRLASPLAGVAFAFIYLSYPALTAAVTFDFHAVTLSAAFLLFALYFLLTRNNVGLFIMCFLAMTTKEEVLADVAMIGLGALVLQRRPRVAFGLIGMALAWAVLYLIVSHTASPLGHSPTASRYAYLGNGPVQVAVYVITHPLEILRDHIFDPQGRLYLRSLLSGAGYLSLLAPVALALAAPIVALNLLSSDATMRSGTYQYNAEIVPFFVLAAIEGAALVVLLTGAASRTALAADVRARLAPALGRIRGVYHEAVDRARAVGTRVVRAGPGTAPSSANGPTSRRASTRAYASRVALVALTLFAVGFSVREQRNHGNLPFSKLLVWPEQTAHTRIANELLTLIPPTASVSAQATLIPHVSERHSIYQFPYMALDSDYVFLDVTAFRYPFNGDTGQYAANVESVLTSPNYHMVAAEDGYLLFKRGAGPVLDPADPLGLPPAFYTFTEQPNSTPIRHPLAVTFGGGLELVGYDVTPTFTPVVATFYQVVTYWRVTGTVPAGAYPYMVQARTGSSPGIYSRFVATTWRPMDTWQPGQTYVVATDNLAAVGGAGDVFTFNLSVLDVTGQPLATTVGAGSSVETLPDGSILLTSVRLV